jgi:hypothetical protein
MQVMYKVVLVSNSGAIIIIDGADVTQRKMSVDKWPGLQYGYWNRPCTIIGRRCVVKTTQKALCLLLIKTR